MSLLRMRDNTYLALEKERTDLGLTPREMVIGLAKTPGRGPATANFYEYRQPDIIDKPYKGLTWKDLK